MRPVFPCTACGGRELYVIDEAKMPDYRYATSFVTLALTGSGKVTGGFFSGSVERKIVRIAAHVCGRCGHTALFAVDLDVLAQLAEAGSVRKVSC